MITNPKKTCLVLDLDDTLYLEYDYQTSGLKYVENKILDLYKIDLKGKLLELRDQGTNDIFLELTKILNIPLTSKDSFLMMYRYHKPDISLSSENKKFIKFALNNFRQVAILTDGRSVSQRLKLNSLGLLQIPVFISEEWSSRKPDKKMFIGIMNTFPYCSQFCYIGDNITKDFIAPNALNWISICLRANKKNVHFKHTNKVKNEYLPKFWVESLSEIETC